MNEQELERRKKLGELKNLNLDPYAVEKVDCNSTIEEALRDCSDITSDEELSSISKSLLGRVVSVRQSFLIIKDRGDTLQIYFSKKDLKSEIYEHFVKYLDLGDIIYVKGTFFKTKTRQLTLRVEDFKIVSKCINPYPSEYYGIQNDELKVRNRVGRALVDREFYNTLVNRSKIIFFLRKYLNKKGYIEMETPILETTYGGANAVPFTTKCEALKENFFLRIATEISLKKAVVSGFSKVYEIGKVFRNEGIDSSHNPEFTSIEIYTANYGMEDVMNLTEELIQGAAKELGIKEVDIEGRTLDITKPFRRLFMNDLVKEKTGLDFYNPNVTLEQAIEAANKQGIKLEDFEKTLGHIFHKLFDDLIADDLFEPTFVYGFHRDVSPLAKTDPKNKNFTLRYELYIGGVEFSNGFAELNDPDDQRSRFEQQQEERAKGNKEAFGIDESFLFALQYGLPPTGGIGIGIDRLVMLLNNQNSIKDVLFIPLIKK